MGTDLEGRARVRAEESLPPPDWYLETLDDRPSQSRWYLPAQETPGPERRHQPRSGQPHKRSSKARHGERHSAPPSLCQ